MSTEPGAAARQDFGRQLLSRYRDMALTKVKPLTWTALSIEPWLRRKGTAGFWGGMLNPWQSKAFVWLRPPATLPLRPNNSPVSYSFLQFSPSADRVGPTRSPQLSPASFAAPSVESTAAFFHQLVSRHMVYARGHNVMNNQSHFTTLAATPTYSAASSRSFFFSKVATLSAPISKPVQTLPAPLPTSSLQSERWSREISKFILPAAATHAFTTSTTNLNFTLVDHPSATQVANWFTRTAPQTPLLSTQVFTRNVPAAQNRASTSVFHQLLTTAPARVSLRNTFATNHFQPLTSCVITAINAYSYPNVSSSSTTYNGSPALTFIHSVVPTKKQSLAPPLHPLQQPMPLVSPGATRIVPPLTEHRRSESMYTTVSEHHDSATSVHTNTAALIAATSAQAPVAIDEKRLGDRILRRLNRELALESERKGMR